MTWLPPTSSQRPIPRERRAESTTWAGGPSRTLSLVELLAFLEERLAKKIPVSHAEPRAGDQPVFVADIRKIERELGWRPTIDPLRGVGLLLDWICQNRRDVERVVEAF
jgi:CDP-paratose 2-epimerase